jgi:hypothetical protein
MKRRAFDKILTAVGIALTVLLVTAGALLTWGHSFANSNVHNQLAAQKIFFPPKGDAYKPQNEIGRYIEKYAGEQLTTGPQAKAYADHFIAVHLSEAANGQTYAQVSAKAMADPKNAELQGQVETLFKGTTLRGMLLNAYGWWKMGQLALWGAIVSFILAGVMAILSLLGLAHLKRVDPETELFGERRTGKSPVTVS